MHSTSKSPDFSFEILAEFPTIPPRDFWIKKGETVLRESVRFGAEIVMNLWKEEVGRALEEFETEGTLEKSGEERSREGSLDLRRLRESIAETVLYR
ncbi:hypothetical protein, partial [Salmonella sp. s55004]|uniref:hypothetical protein n=1 Tax=Salmonella sp. s55004 TaxID=3159675 RepID=UPI00397F0040